MQLQPELGETRPEFLQTRFRVSTMFEGDQEVVRVADDDSITVAATFTPSLYP
jgi:hypothetical protein